MPIYEYQCESCGHAVEVLLRRFDEQPECPDCGGSKLDKLMSVPASPSTGGGGQLPVASSGEACGMPRCCGGGCQM
ncbi:Zinc ribbon domain protein [Rosistilla carotiformis]|uniref:Zinc ribbon domain protein n=1 Tax=Rosistilla carotiformis TaxID=2528017 RepID=A0A518JS80_9BACT|nr:zinc ribbon domain-containing protein [Rosistilla carotiformis]QDV68403.1 Zinc ribbon domain protein [Rosistilla carotiformis]